MLISKTQITWKYETPLTSGAAVLIPIAMELSGITLEDCSYCRYMTWGLISSHNCRFEVLGCNSPAFVIPDTLYLQNAVGAAYTTPFLLAAPVGQSGDVILTRPFIRIRLTDTATSDHTYTRLYVVAWW